MEDTQTLLMMVLKQHFRERPQILDEALRVIKEYSNKDLLQSEYEKTLHTLQDKMNDLPNHILLYFLSMVPLPKQCEPDYASPLMEEMKNSDYQTTDSIRPKLVEYLNSKIPPLVPIGKDVPEVSECDSRIMNRADDVAPASFVQPKKKRRNTKNVPKDCKSLLDICAEHVVKNQNFLNQYYKHRKEKVWRLVNSNRYDKDQLCLLYEVIRDVNKKAKLMRMIDCDEVSREVIYELYGNSDVFLKESNLYESVCDDPFELSEKLREAIIKFVSN